MTIYLSVGRRKSKHNRGTWVTQLVKRLTLDFCSGHDLTVVRFSFESGSVLGMEPDRDYLSTSLSDLPPLMYACSLSLKKIKKEA